jgi:actin-like ATPase involved in cell morphogenesis
MSNPAFGIDFGTTNSLAALVSGNQVISLVDNENRPHPSVIWYRGSETLVGRDARQYLDVTEGGAPAGFVRSPKMRLRRGGQIYVDGRPVDPTDAVAEVLKHLKKDAAIARDRAAGHVLDRAVMTIPVDFGGPERQALREAAKKAGIGVIQFVHEPVAALYAHLRSKTDFRSELASLEGRSMLVFDWGGGTLDLTLCRIHDGSIMQVANLGDNTVGGDEFDNRLRNLFREKHAAAHGLEDVTALEQPGMAAKLLHQCEFVKIGLSNSKTEIGDVIIKNFLKTEKAGRDLRGSVTKKELENLCANLISGGLSKIDAILKRAGLAYQDIDLCLATGGMVNMPAIRDGLTERFFGRAPILPNGDRIIAEGAAWIAHDGLRLTLSKPIELLVADSSGYGSYYPLVPAGLKLPMENQIIPAANSRLFCVDPREGIATFEFAKPVKIGTTFPNDPRETVCVASVPVDPKAPPMLERLECQLQIDHNYVVHILLSSTARGAKASAEFHNLDFSLALLKSDDASGITANDDKYEEYSIGGEPIFLSATGQSTVAQRSNVVVEPKDATVQDDLWRFVPGDIVARWKPEYFDVRNRAASKRQEFERGFYVPCARCRRLESQIKAEGPVEECRGRACGATLAPLPQNEPLKRGA